MKRVLDWEIALHEFAGSQVGRKFVWGETNCIALALHAIDVQCGTSLHAKGRHFMSSALRARAFVVKEGLAGLVARLTKEGMVVLDVKFARVGDIYFTETPETIGAAIVLGRNCLSSTEQEGVRLYPSREIARSVAVGVR